MSASEVCTSTVNEDLNSFDYFSVGIVASPSEVQNEYSFSRLTYLCHEVVKKFESNGMKVLDFNVLNRKIFASLRLSRGDKSKLSDVFFAINEVAINHNVTFDFDLVDVDDFNAINNLLGITAHESSKCQDRHRFSKGEIAAAIKGNSFAIYCQPLVDLKSAIPKGVEFLVRWNHPTQGLLFPDAFLSEIERHGLETDLDLLILDSAKTELICWGNNENLKHLSISVNLYCCSLKSERLLYWLESFHLLHPSLVSKLILEITETGIIDDGGTAHENMQFIQSLGYNVSLDDFGSGTSICRYLTYLNPNEIKIDRSLINIAFDQNNKKASVALKMLRSMIGWVQEMDGVALVVEGIESMEQLEYLKSLGVDTGQGYVYSRPVPVNQFLESCKGNIDVC